MEVDLPADADDVFVEGRRVGRYLLVRDIEGTLHAISSGSVSALCELDDGCVVMLTGGRLLKIGRSMRTILGWLEVGAR